MSVIIKLLSKFDDSGLKKAKSGFGGLSKTLGAVGIGFGITQITNGLLDAAKAAAADEKSTRLLNTQLARNAGATKGQLKQNDAFIESLSLQTGIMDDDLRPAMARFGNVTGNVKDAQKLLKITVDAAAGSQLSQTKIAKAVAQAYGGNTKALQNMFPQLKKSKDVLGDFAKTYEGLAEANADPFMKFNNSMDILKEKLGVVVLPLIIDFIDEISKEGGAIEVVGKFFDDLANPKSDAGKTFEDIKDAVGQTIQGVKDFFALFGGGDAMKGFATVAGNLIKMLPALLALKGIMMLAQSATAIRNLIIAMTAIQGKNPLGNTPVGKAAKFIVPAAIVAGTVEPMLTEFSKPQVREDFAKIAKDKVKQEQKIFVGKDGKDSSGNVVNNITINAPNMDPKVLIDLLGKYVKTNGSIPQYIMKPKG